MLRAPVRMAASARTFVWVALAWSLVPGLAPAADAPAARKVRVAVMEIRPLGTDPVKAELLSEIALTEASRLAGLEVVGKSDLAGMLGFERQKQLLGCGEEASCLAEIAGGLGVDHVLLGSLGRLGALYRIDLKVVDARKARVLSRAGESVSGEEEQLVAAVQKAVREVLAPIAPPPAIAAGAAAKAAASSSGGSGAPSPFDGRWRARVRCEAHRDAKALDFDLDGTVTNGMLLATRGVEGQPGWLRVTGTVAPDGSAALVARGLTGARAFSLGGPRPGTPLDYRVTARFAGKRGTGNRIDGRPCSFAFERR